MAFAPAAMQHDFWRRYNHRSKYEWRKAISVGDLLGRLLPDGAVTATSGGATKLDDAWRQTVPTMYHARTRAESLNRRCLRVVVDSAATRFKLSREIGAETLKGLSEQLGGVSIVRIDYRVGSVPAQATFGSIDTAIRNKTLQAETQA